MLSFLYKMNWYIYPSYMRWTGTWIFSCSGLAEETNPLFHLAIMVSLLGESPQHSCLQTVI